MPRKSGVKKIKKISGIPLSVFDTGGVVYMLSKTNKNSLYFSKSDNGFDFIDDPEKVIIKISDNKKEDIKYCRDFSISVTPTGFVMVYVRDVSKNKKPVFVVARTSNLYEWKVKSEIEVLDSTRSSIIYNKKLDIFEIYSNGLFFKRRSSRTLSFWKEKPSLIATSRFGMFDEGVINIIGSSVVKDGMLFMYDASVREGNKILLQIGGMLFDYDNPNKTIWRSDSPIWQGVVELRDYKTKLNPLGFCYIGNKFAVYWFSQEGEIIVVTFPALFKEEEIINYQILSKFQNNPIISPRQIHHWEYNGTFNPAVFEDQGVIHILYRALGSDGISRVGYAQSKNGLSITKRHPFPVFEPRLGLGMPDEKNTEGPIGFHPAIYTSGGGWGGSEDPRVVKIGNRIYMIYVAFEGWNSVRIALTSISVKDFRDGKWNWRVPKLISAPETVNKNWLIFPEKINGKFAILNSITPEIDIQYVDDIDNIKGFLQSKRKDGPQPGREDFWDNRLRGAGPPPIKTDLGWLLLYHAVDNREPHKYKLGAMILDKNNPTKILYRSNHPILYPEMWYENEGKPGIVYASGALIIGKDLYVYYGGGDRVVCLATTDLKSFLDYMVSGKPDNYKLDRVSVPSI